MPNFVDDYARPGRILPPVAAGAARARGRVDGAAARPHRRRRHGVLAGVGILVGALAARLRRGRDRADPAGLFSLRLLSRTAARGGVDDRDRPATAARRRRVPVPRRRDLAEHRTAARPAARPHRVAVRRAGHRFRAAAGASRPGRGGPVRGCRAAASGAPARPSVERRAGAPRRRRGSSGPAPRRTDEPAGGHDDGADRGGGRRRRAGVRVLPGVRRARRRTGHGPVVVDGDAADLVAVDDRRPHVRLDQPARAGLGVPRRVLGVLLRGLRGDRPRTAREPDQQARAHAQTCLAVRAVYRTLPRRP